MVNMTFTLYGYTQLIPSFKYTDEKISNTCLAAMEYVQFSPSDLQYYTEVCATNNKPSNKIQLQTLPQALINSFTM